MAKQKFSIVKNYYFFTTIKTDIEQKNEKKVLKDRMLLLISYHLEARLLFFEEYTCLDMLIAALQTTAKMALRIAVSNVKNE